MNKYQREIKPGTVVDVYDVLKAFNVICPAMAHAIKKCLAPGQRGVKDATQDKEEAIASIQRSIQMESSPSGPKQCPNCGSTRQCIDTTGRDTTTRCGACKCTISTSTKIIDECLHVRSARLPSGAIQCIDCLWMLSPPVTDEMIKTKSKWPTDEMIVVGVQFMLNHDCMYTDKEINLIFHGMVNVYDGSLLVGNYHLPRGMKSNDLFNIMMKAAPTNTNIYGEVLGNGKEPGRQV